MIMLIWSFSFGLLTILDTLVFHLVMYLENVSPTPCLVVSKSLKVTSIMIKRLPFSRIQIGVGMCFLDFDGGMIPKKKPHFH